MHCALIDSRPPTSEPVIWLRRRNYRIVSLNLSLSGHSPALGMSIERGVYAYPDSQRPDFYDIELENGRAYVRVHDDARTVYLVAYGNSASFIHS